ncbi:MAG: radical SAM protein [Planctomycetes bacterium]|nr:radical SAM protein [Planctomycetota bacterium]
MDVFRQAVTPPEVLFVHAPYPGRLKFRAVPSSMFAAAGPFVVANRDRQATYLDPGSPTPEFYAHLESLLATGRVRALCISTSTAAIEETARIAATSSLLAPETLVIVGGPHENDIDNKSANRLPGVHLSIGGEASSALRNLLELYLSDNRTAEEFVRGLHPRNLTEADTCGTFTVASSCWPAGVEFDQGPSRFRDPRPLLIPENYPRFDVFSSPATIPLMVSRGCSYGRCTFCAEANRDGSVIRTSDYEWIARLADRAPEAALYFQDSIFPAGNDSSSELLPLLRNLGREWGCQVYLPTLTERRIAELADHGCTYLYTGIESGAPDVLEGIRKPKVQPRLVAERTRWIAKKGPRVGLSLMFGSMSTNGVVLENERSLNLTRDLTDAVRDTGVRIAGFYPNVQTVLPGTQLARGIAAAGQDLDFYTMPRAPIFDGLEDGGVGYNFLTVATPSANELSLAESIVATAKDIQHLGVCSW